MLCEYCGGHPRHRYSCYNCGAPVPVGVEIRFTAEISLEAKAHIAEMFNSAPRPGALRVHNQREEWDYD